MVVQLAESWLELEKSQGGQRFVLTGDVPAMRETLKGLIAAMAPLLPPPSPNLTVETKEVHNIPVRIYSPHEKTKQGKLPFGIFFHPGGYCIGDCDLGDQQCRLVAEQIGCVIVSVDYRLAPEHKTPAQLEDCMTVWKWARENADSLGADANKMFTIGVSAGGGLTLQVANKLVKDPSTRGQIKGAVPLCPITVHPDHVPPEYRSMYKAWEENAEGVPILDRNAMLEFLKATGVDPKDPDQFVALAAENHKYYPPTYVVSCEADPLRDDAFMIEAALKKAGVPVKHDTYKGLPHVFWDMPVPESKTFHENLLKGVSWIVGQMK